MAASDDVLFTGTAGGKFPKSIFIGVGLSRVDSASKSLSDEGSTADVGSGGCTPGSGTL